jgi:hypothetical protein
LKVLAWYGAASDDGGWVGSFVIIDVTVSGPQFTSGTTTGDRYSPLKMDLTPGTYTVSGIYNEIVRSVNAIVEQGKTVTGVLNFGEAPLPPWGPHPF